MFFATKPKSLLDQKDALVGRDAPIPTAETHLLTGNPLKGPYPDGFQQAIFAMGCFWGAERRFWRQPGVWVTSAVYAGGITPNPTYREVCSGMTGHTEGVHVVWDPSVITFADLLKVFWEAHDPTQGMRQGNDVGTQYRSAIYVDDPDLYDAAVASREAYQGGLTAAGLGTITTEIQRDVSRYLAEEDHQQYLEKVPNGYCGLRGTGVACAI